MRVTLTKERTGTGNGHNGHLNRAREDSKKEYVCNHPVFGEVLKRLPKTDSGLAVFAINEFGEEAAEMVFYFMLTAIIENQSLFYWSHNHNAHRPDLWDITAGMTLASIFNKRKYISLTCATPLFFERYPDFKGYRKAYIHSVRGGK